MSPKTIFTKMCEVIDRFIDVSLIEYSRFHTTIIQVHLSIHVMAATAKAPAVQMSPMVI